MKKILHTNELSRFDFEEGSTKQEQCQKVLEELKKVNCDKIIFAGRGEDGNIISITHNMENTLEVRAFIKVLYDLYVLPLEQQIKEKNQKSIINERKIKT